MDSTPLIKTVKTRYGDMQIHGDDYYVGRSLELYGEYSRDEAALFAKIVKPGWTVIEAGANIGALTLPLIELVGIEGEVYAFEPQPENFVLLWNNCCAHSNVVIQEKALGDEDGETHVEVLADFAGGGEKNYGGVRTGSGTGIVPMQKLDTVTDGANVDFIKIDVEGFEEKVLAGAAKTIARCHPIIYCEIPKDREGPLLRALHALGYRCWAHTPVLFSKENHNNNPMNAFPGIVSFNLLCIPKECALDYRDVVKDLILKAPPAASADKWACVCRFGGVGDNLIAASVLRPLKAAGYKTEVITSKPHSVVFENNPNIDKLTVKNTKRDLPQNDQLAWNNWFRARAGEYDLFANVSHTMELSLAFMPAQTQYWWPPAFRRKISAHNYLEFVHDLFGMSHDFGPLFFPTDEEKEAAHDTRKRIGESKPLVGWCLVGTRPDKVHPQAPMAIARVIKELGATVVMFGGPPPRPDHEFAKQIQDHVRNQNGDDKGLYEAISPDPQNETWGIRRVLAMASVCDLVIGPDTGPMWGVAFEPMPKVVLLSHASEENIAKHWINTTALHADQAKVPCWPCHLLHDNIDTCQETQERAGIKVDYEQKGAACMMSITVEQVVQAVRKGLEHGSRVPGASTADRSAIPAEHREAAE